MKQSRFHYLGALAVLSAAALQLYGCGGMGAVDGTGTNYPPPPPSASGKIDGGADTGSTTVPEQLIVTPAGGKKLTDVTVTTATGETVTMSEVIIPSGIYDQTATGQDKVIAPGTTFAVIPAGKPLVNGSFPQNTPVTINGTTNSGVTLNSDGTLSTNVALPIDPAGTDYSVRLPKLTISGRVLNVGAFEVEGKMYPGKSIIPTKFDGIIPNNGENAVGARVTAEFTPQNDGRDVTLRIEYGNGFVLEQTRTIVGGKVTFQNLSTDAVSVPDGGVSLVKITVRPIPGQ